MKRHTVFGPPGTGKTTRLMEMLEERIAILHASNIAFCSFTKQGTNEGAGRAKKRFKLSDFDLRFFRTLHSLCFRELGANRADMISRRHYLLFSKQTGINFSGFYNSDFSSTNDVYLHLLSMENHNEACANLMFKQINKKKYEYVKYQYKELKKQLGIMDFDDLLLDYLKKGRPLPVKCALIDEAQDLTPLQWRVAMKMFSATDEIIIAGDDDQAVYEWSGADVNIFLNFSKSQTVLSKSYRLPKTALNFSAKIAKEIFTRKDKYFISNGRQGKLSTARSLDKVRLKGGELVLARTNKILQEMTTAMLEKGLPYKLKGKLSWDRQIVSAIKLHRRYIAGKIPEELLNPVRHLFEHISIKSPWMASIKLPTHEKQYYGNLIDNIDKEPVLFETFHSCKGSENKHVIISTDLSKKVYDNFAESRDAELRCLYVASTRTQDRMTILKPSGKLYYPTKYIN